MSFIKYSVMFLIISGWSFLFGFKISQNHGLDMCKKAGWEFIDEIFYKPNPKTEAYKKETAWLQLNIATKCKIKFK